MIIIKPVIRIHKTADKKRNDTPIKSIFDNNLNKVRHSKCEVLKGIIRMYGKENRCLIELCDNLIAQIEKNQGINHYEEKC